MNNKITFPRLATMLADQSGRSKRFSEDFLREFFSLISESLEIGESVKIKGFGTFRLSRVEPRKSVDVTTGLPMEISGHSKVVFVPAKELAEAVNAPFEAFSSIEISDDTDIEQLMSNEDYKIEENADYIEENEDIEEISVEDTANEEEITEQTTSDETSETGGVCITYSKFVKPSEPEPTLPTENSSVTVDSELDSIPEAAEDPAGPENTDDSDDSDDLDDEFSYQEPSRKKNWIKGILISLAAAVVALFATFAIWYVFATNDFNRIFRKDATAKAEKSEPAYIVGKGMTTGTGDSDIKIATDSVADVAQENESENEVPTAPSDAVVYDTISTTRYLTTMAKAHYGNYHLWPYIYEENKAILGHPDRIRPGTPVVIPKLSKYGVDPYSAADIEKAKKMGIAIYAKYGKSI